ncbi:nucleotide exchange factor GrpE [Apilactobacillus apisilvae]|uniref:Protein GrpE n=1 Tax=Apilactobacillus apisilvae TaxID=2923364 RepID=A0ABY4PI68_9LACO|nr:nucleotide exchange factor GrpE [Apilactobacillus apisilvae]UQS85469.1 nucleotide exchange factor GrpE [Apilactobacillus apisilvae]
MANKDDKKDLKQSESEKDVSKKEAKATKKDAKKKQKNSDQDKIKELEQKVDSVSDQYLRAEAEMQNMQTRFKRERADIYKYDGQKLATSILPVVDNLERALSTEVTDDSGKQLKQGVELVLNHMNKSLAENGIKEIDALGKKFDPTLCQAVQTVPADDDHPADTVVEILQKGYQLADRVIRPSMVIVSQ